MPRTRSTYLLQMIRIAEKGYQAFLDGVPESECPYKGGYNGGGNVQLVRRKQWYAGWNQAKREAKENAHRDVSAPR